MLIKATPISHYLTFFEALQPRIIIIIIFNFLKEFNAGPILYLFLNKK